jgi:uncharacterized protein
MLRQPVPAADTLQRFAEPTPLGLIGLALGCAALVPIAFGTAPSANGFATAGMFCLLFGAGCQLLAGLMSFANRNLYGGTLFTAFAFYWTLNWWALDSSAAALLGEAVPLPDPATILASDVLALVVFAVLTYGFGFHSKLLFAFLLDIDLMFICKVVNGAAGTHALDPAVAWLTVGLAVIALWIAFAILINPTAGRAVFPVTGPLFTPTPPPPGFAFELRHAIFDSLYAHWRQAAFRPMPLGALQEAAGSDVDLLPDLHYLAERGGVKLAFADGGGVEGARLTAAGIDLYEERILRK